jgi:hypothetical protein
LILYPPPHIPSGSAQIPTKFWTQSKQKKKNKDKSDPSHS